MLEVMLDLDAKGIIPKAHWSADRYIAEGSAMLESAAMLEVDEAYSRAFWRKHGVYIDCKADIPKNAARSIHSAFRADVSWIPMLCSTGDIHLLGEFLETGTINRTRSVPAIVIYGDAAESVIFHECAHAIRNFVDFRSYGEFEEAIANYREITSFHFLPLGHSYEKAVRDAKKKLEDFIGLMAGYALIRLTPPEIEMIGHALKPAQCLKSMGSLRHRIVKERLGI